MTDLGWKGLLLVLLLPAGVVGQSLEPDAEARRPEVRGARLSTPLSLDGRLDEAAWDAAEVVSDFTQIDPEEGEPASQRTEARVLYDDEALYIGVTLYDDGPVTFRLGRRDMSLLDSDWFGVVIDSYHDHRTGFSFDVNPAGVMRDAVKSMGPGGQEMDDLSWDAVWRVEARRDENGWSAEYRIPFSQLRFGSDSEQTWGIQLERVIGRLREYSVFSFTPKTESGGMPAFGHLTGLRDVEPGNRLEVLPYVVTRAEYVDPGANPFRTDSELFGSGGVDLLYRVTSDFTLNASINPDFGQVEVDPAVINLSVYETFFEEKRPFFVEGSEIFGFGRNTSGGQLFYTKRIGRRPQLGAPTQESDVPDATTILAAGKLTGKTASGWSVGILEAVTAEETARYMNGGVPGEAVVEPLANYFVSRVRRDGRAGQSAVGAMLTATNRSLGTDVLRESLRESAYAGGIDFRHEWANRNWVVRGSLVSSRIAGDPLAIVRVQRSGNHFFQRPDADHLEVDVDATSMTGYSTGIAVAKQAGRHWRGQLAVAATSPDFEVNDLGFQRRTDRRDAALNLTYQETTPGTFLRDYSVTGSVRYEHNYSNQRILNYWSLRGRFVHLNFWNASLNYRYRAPAVDDRSTRGGPLMRRPAGWSVNGDFHSDGRKSVTFGVGGGGGPDEYGGWNATLFTSVGLKTSSRWNLEFSPSLRRSLSKAQYVGTVPDATATETYGAHYLFAPLRQTTLVMETRLNLTFTPRLSFQLYAQPFISSGDYAVVGQLSAPRSYRFSEYTGAVPDSDFNLRSLRGTAVLRWEWRPGSTLFLAWQQTRSDFAEGVGDFDFGRDRQAMFAAEPDNIFVLKMNYWLSP